MNKRTERADGTVRTGLAALFAQPVAAAAFLVNALLVAGILFMIVTLIGEWDNPKLWIFAGVVLACPALNLAGLYAWPGAAVRILAIFCNSASLVLWGGMIVLMMVWPLGSKPRGMDLVVLLGSWAVLALTECVLIRQVVRYGKQRRAAGGK